MKTIEDIASAFEGLSPASDNRWNVATLIADRLHISRADDGQYAVFIEGDLNSFGKLPDVGGLDHSIEVTAVPAARTFAALRLTCRDAVHGNRVLSHIAYELARRLEAQPSIANEELFRQIEWVLLLLGANDEVLSSERQRGLVGECLLLRRLLILGRRAGLAPGTVLSRWWGHQPARRDFAADSIAIEVKTTGHNFRHHHIGSIEQLDPQSSTEKVYLFSVGIKSDASASKKLPHFVADVDAQLISVDGVPDETARALYRKQLGAYGYDPSRESYYLGAPGYMKPHLPGALFKESDLARLRYDSFVEGHPPAMVSNVSYTLDVTCEPLSEGETEQVLTQLLLSPATGPTVGAR